MKRRRLQDYNPLKDLNEQRGFFLFIKRRRPVFKAAKNTLQCNTNSVTHTNIPEGEHRRADPSSALCTVTARSVQRLSQRTGKASVQLQKVPWEDDSSMHRNTSQRAAAIRKLYSNGLW